jgi:hypothetical protein
MLGMGGWVMVSLHCFFKFGRKLYQNREAVYVSHDGKITGVDVQNRNSARFERAR